MNDVLLDKLLFFDISYNINDIDNFDSILDEIILLDDDDGVIMNINDIDALICFEDYSIYKQEICCLCGVSKQKHTARRHKYIQIKKEYRCKKCSLFFFQHDHIKQPCFIPFKYIS